MKNIIEQFKVESTEDILGVKMINHDKFAELIVRECASVIFKEIGPRSALTVLEHFGLEE